MSRGFFHTYLADFFQHKQYYRWPMTRGSNYILNVEPETFCRWSSNLVWPKTSQSYPAWYHNVWVGLNGCHILLHVSSPKIFLLCLFMFCLRCLILIVFSCMVVSFSFGSLRCSSCRVFPVLPFGLAPDYLVLYCLSFLSALFILFYILSFLTCLFLSNRSCLVPPK